jgi:hypothetical protein
MPGYWPKYEPLPIAGEINALPRFIAGAFARPQTGRIGTDFSTPPIDNGSHLFRAQPMA